MHGCESGEFRGVGLDQRHVLRNVAVVCRQEEPLLVNHHSAEHAVLLGLSLAAQGVPGGRGDAPVEADA